jgi:hypothetical protein
VTFSEKEPTAKTDVPETVREISRDAPIPWRIQKAGTERIEIANRANKTRENLTNTRNYACQF